MNKVCLYPCVLILVFLSVSAGRADDYGAVYNTVDYVCEIIGNKARVVEQTMITVSQKSGSEYVRLSFMESGFISLDKIVIEVFDSDGKKVYSIQKGDMAKACGFGRGYQLYSDICHYFKEIAYPRYPYTVKIYVEKEIESLFFWRGVRYQRSIPVESFSYRLICPKDFEFAYKMYGSDTEPVIDSVSGKYYYSWELGSIAALEDVDHAPGEYLNLGRLIFVADKFKFDKFDFEGDSWNDIASFYAELSRECYLTSDFKIPPTSELKDDLRDIYDNIINSNRYVSVAIDIGGWQPHETKFISERGYGDCKDLSTLLISRLSGFDIEAYPCLALTRGYGETDTAFPNYDFNHVFVLAVNKDDTLWMDPTCGKCPIGEIPYDDENINVLVVKDTGGVIRKTKCSLPDDNAVLKNGRVSISKNGSMEISFVNTYTGHFARIYRHRIEESTEEEFISSFVNVLPGGDKNFVISDLSIRNAEDIYKPLIIECLAKRKKPADFFRNTYYIPVDIFESMVPFSNLNLKDRETGVRVSFPSLYKYELEFCWDSTLVPDSVGIPLDTSLETSFGTISCNYNISGNTVKAALSRSSLRYLIEPSEFDSLMIFRDRCRALSGKHIKLYCSD